MLSQNNLHPDEKQLALYSGDDLSALDRLRVRWHVRSCAQCAEQVKAITAVSDALRSQIVEVPRGVQWDRLAAEMTANIHLGQEVGECVGPGPIARPERIGWRAAVVMAGMTVMLIGAWFLNPPRRIEKLARHSPIEIHTAPGGIEMKENGAALMLLHTRGQQTPIIVSTPGSLRARFVDQDTGQVTINNVYTD